MLGEKIRTGHSGQGYFWSKSFNSLLSRNMTYSKKKMKQTPLATRAYFIFKKLAIITT